MGNPDPRVGIVMITHNRVGELLHSLDVLTRLPERPRIVMVDNASTDGTAEAVAARFPGVEILRSEENLGAAGRNLDRRPCPQPRPGLPSVRRPDQLGYLRAG